MPAKIIIVALDSAIKRAEYDKNPTNKPAHTKNTIGSPRVKIAAMDAPMAMQGVFTQIRAIKISIINRALK